ncbi:MAG: Ig-like domain-containing protein [Lachnospiraceae bacterium]
MERKNGMRTRMLACMLAVSVAVSAGEGNLAPVQAAALIQAQTTLRAAAKVKAIKLNYKDVTLKAGKKLKLKVAVSPKNATVKAITWKSSNRKVAEVSSNGTVKAKKKGNAIITATVKGTNKKATCRIRVGIPVTKVAVKKSSVSLQEGKTSTIATVISPQNATNKGVTYQSANTKIATVSSKGKITAKKAGKTTITVTANDGSKKKATVKVTVQKKNVSVTSVQVNVDRTSLKIGEYVQASAVVSPTNATDPSVEWSSSKESVAFVSQKGMIVAQSEGTTTITATAKNGKKGEVVIFVSSDVEEPSIPEETSIPENVSEPTQPQTPSISNPSSVQKPSTKPSESESEISSTPSGSGSTQKPGSSEKPSQSKPSGGSGSSIPAQPSDSSKPSGSMQPSGSQKPSDSIQPGSTSKPSGSMQPSDAQKPSGSSGSSKPSESSQPGGSQKPSTPQTPSEPSTPSVAPSIPQQNTEELQFILTWEGDSSETESVDLDAHLIGPGAEKGETFHTYFANRTYQKNGVVYAQMEKESEDSDSQEIIHVYQKSDGVYHFYVYNFGVQQDGSPVKFSDVKGTVTVMAGGKEIQKFTAPSAEGTLWDVCTYDSTNESVEKVNTISDFSGASEDVGLAESEAASRSLSRLIEQYDGVSFGTDVHKQAQSKLTEAKKLIEEGKDAQTLNKAQDELETYFEDLMNSTKISDLTGTGLSDEMEITRRGEKDANKEYSVIELQGSSEQLPEDLQVKIEGDNADAVITYEKQGEFDAKISVKGKNTNAEETYYIMYMSLEDSMIPTGVSEDGNTITDFSVDTDYDETGAKMQVIHISGEQASLRNPVFTFVNEKIKGNYANGKLTVTYAGKTVTYSVQYTQIEVQVRLLQAGDSENFMLTPEESWDYDDDGNRCFTYTITGATDTFSKSTPCTFNVQPDQYQIEETDLAGYDAQITVTYKGKDSVIYVKYQQDTSISPLPKRGTYQQNGKEVSFATIAFQSNQKTVRLTGEPDDIPDWSSVQFSANGNLTYTVDASGKQPKLLVKQADKILAEYVVEYEKEIASIAITEITASDNIITSFDFDYGWDETDAQYDILHVTGKNDTVGTLTAKPSDQAATVKFESLKDDARGSAKLTVTYKSQTKVYYIQYEKDNWN